MLDFRAWIVACIILVSAVGAYVIWVKRPHVGYNARSLTGPGQPANPAFKVITKTLHVEGCNDDFIVKPGELVEPRVLPGASLEQFEAVYGKEKRPEARGLRTWEQYAFSLTDNSAAAEKPSDFVHISVNQGHVVETLDGVDLGIDSFGAIFRKMSDRKVEVHESIQRTGENWTLIMSFYSACGRKFRSEYSRTLPASKELDNQITPRQADTKSATAPWRSAVFMNKVVTEYSIAPSSGHDESPDGSPAEHN